MSDALLLMLMRAHAFRGVVQRPACFAGKYVYLTPHFPQCSNRLHGRRPGRDYKRDR